jgi:hypothetical protein
MANVAWEIGAQFLGGNAVFIWGPICTAVESKQEVRRRGASGRGVALATYSHLAPRLKKE